MTDSQKGGPSQQKGARKALRGERWIYGGTTLIAIGVIASLADLADVGAQATLGGFLAAVFGLHLLGRSGPPAQTT